MSEQSAALEGVTVAEAAAILGVSTATVRRMVKRGQLEGRRVIRPQGTAFVIILPEHATDASEDAAPTLQAAGVTPRDNASAGAQLAAWSETFLLPLVASLERSQAIVCDQAETIGRQSAELERAASTIVALGEEVESLRASHSPVAGQQTASAPETAWKRRVTRPPLVEACPLACRPGRGRGGAAGGRRLGGVAAMILSARIRLYVWLVAFVAWLTVTWLALDW